MKSEILATFNTMSILPSFMAYLVVALILTGLFIALYIRITPYKEFEQIGNGNVAVGISLGGAILGFVIALASVILHSVNLAELVLWGGIALLVQIIAYLVVCFAVKNLAKGIEGGNISQGIFLGVLSVCFGILNGACIVP